MARGDMRYRPEIDGLRALAVLPVILFHAGFDTFSGGFVGVDVFFVISGYLITSIIYNDIKDGSFSIALFYERRARRILPPLFLVCLACIPFAWLWMLPEAFENFGESIVAVSIFASNFFFWQDSNYFAAPAELKPLLHTWTLAVEEQFYILFPLFLLLVRKLNRKAFLVLLVGLSVLSLGLAQWSSTTHPSANFYLLPGRAWELGAGAIMAITADAWSDIKGWLAQVASALGLALIVYAVLVFDRATPFPSLWGLIPVLGTALVIAYARPQTLAGKLLGLGPVVGVGLVSYSAYLWHQPLFAFARIRSWDQVSTSTYLGLVALSFALAFLSWRLVERPFRNRRNFTRKQIFGGASVIAGSLVGIGLLCSLEPRSILMLEDRLTAAQLRVLAMVEQERERERTQDDRFVNQECVFHDLRVTESNASAMKACAAIHGPGIAIIGDSHAGDLFQAIAKNYSLPFLVGFSQGNCRPHTYYDYCQYEGFLDFVAKNPRIFQGIIYNQAGFYLLMDGDGSEGNREMFHREQEFLYIPNEENINYIYDYLVQLSDYSNVFWFGPWIEPHLRDRYLIFSGCDNPEWKINENAVRSYMQLDSYLSETFLDRGSVKYISTMSYLDFDIQNDLMNCDDVFFSDEDHWSEPGEVRFGLRLAPIVNELFADQMR
jgi:peptidoglycan/LPS O-acetylase OafA/YrhL